MEDERIRRGRGSRCGGEGSRRWKRCNGKGLEVEGSGEGEVKRKDDEEGNREEGGARGGGGGEGWGRRKGGER